MTKKDNPPKSHGEADPDLEHDLTFIKVAGLFRTFQGPVRVVEIGCGQGAFAIKGLRLHLSAYELKKLQYTGVNIDRETLDLAQEQAGIHKFDITCLKSPPAFILLSEFYKKHDDSVDIIFLIRTLHDIPLKDLDSLYYHIFRVLTPAGRLIIFDKAELADSSEVIVTIWREDDFEELFEAGTVNFWPLNQEEQKKWQFITEIRNTPHTPSKSEWRRRFIRLYESKKDYYSREIDLLKERQEADENKALSPEDERIKDDYLKLYACIEKQLAELPGKERAAAVTEPHGGQASSPCTTNRSRKLLNNYLQAALAEHRHLPVKGFQTHLRVPIELERVYVSMQAHIQTHDQGQSHENQTGQGRRLGADDLVPSSLDMQTAFAMADRNNIKDIVVLGKPGSGKTTLLKYILVMLAQNRGQEKLGQANYLVPFLAPLRKLADPETEDFLSFIYRCSGLEDHGISKSILKQIFENKCGIVLLDGLDEVADEAMRRKTCQWIDRARKRLLPTTRFVVTSRYAGYFGENRLQDGVLELRIQDFNLGEVREFLCRWFEIVAILLHPNEDEERWREKGRAEGEALTSTIAGLDHIKKLAVNPLLLQIIALVHHDRHHIPERRVDLYEECTNVLLERWDMAKGLKVLLSAKEARKVLQPLALWLHEVDQRRSATFEEIRDVLKTPLEEIGKSGIDPELLLKNIRDRSGIFMGQSEKEYGFAHHSFQEYFTAEEVRNKNKIELLVSKYEDRWWREVILLCLALDNPSVIEPFMEKLIPLPPFAREITLALDAIHDSISKPITPFIKALENENLPSENRANSVRALVVLGGERAVEALKKAMKSGDKQLANIAFGALQPLNVAEGVVRPETEDVTSRIINPKDGSEMVLIPAGTFLYGSKEDDEMARSNEKPQRVLELPSFYMDLHPVTNAQYCHFLNVVKPAAKELEKLIRLSGKFSRERCRIKHSGEFFVEEGYEKHPVIYVTWHGAHAYAVWAGKELPTELQWEKAARGTDGRVWPWGNEFDKSRCNTSEGGPGHTTPVGGFRQGLSPYGCLDMAGNVWEWTADWYDKDKDARVLRGGAWFYFRDFARCSIRNRADPYLRNGNVGFRCARTL